MKLWIFPKKSFDFRSVHWSHLFLFVRFKKPPKLNCAEVKRCFQLYFQCDFKLDAQRVCMNTHAHIHRVSNTVLFLSFHMIRQLIISSVNYMRKCNDQTFCLVTCRIQFNRTIFYSVFSIIASVLNQQ